MHDERATEHEPQYEQTEVQPAMPCISGLGSLLLVRARLDNTVVVDELL
ncbi:hypothetical protein [Kibdelosporangium philippinense]